MSYYNSIHKLTLARWEKAQQGDLTSLRKDEIGVSEESDTIIWEQLNFEYMEMFGLSRKHIQFNMLSRKLMMLELEYFETEKAILKNDIRRTKRELDELFKKENSELVTLDETLVYLSKFMGYRLDKDVISVVEYFNIKEIYGKAN